MHWTAGFKSQSFQKPMYGTQLAEKTFTAKRRDKCVMLQIGKRSQAATVLTEIDVSNSKRRFLSIKINSAPECFHWPSEFYTSFKVFLMLKHIFEHKAPQGTWLCDMLSTFTPMRIPTFMNSWFGFYGRFYNFAIENRQRMNSKCQTTIFMN